MRADACCLCYNNKSSVPVHEYKSVNLMSNQYSCPTADYCGTVIALHQGHQAVTSWFRSTKQTRRLHAQRRRYSLWLIFVDLLTYLLDSVQIDLAISYSHRKHNMANTFEERQPAGLPALSGLSALGKQAQQFRCQVASGLQQRFDGAVRAVTQRFPQDR